MRRRAALPELTRLSLLATALVALVACRGRPSAPDDDDDAAPPAARSGPAAAHPQAPAAAPTASAAPPRPAPAATGPEARCDRVADHLVALLAADLPEEARAAAEQHLAEQRSELAESCRVRGLSAADERCILAARASDDAAACEHPGAAGEETPAAPPDPSLRPRCERIVAHVQALMTREMAVPPAQHAEVLAQMERESFSLVERCVTERVGADQEKCALAAETVRQLERCQRWTGGEVE